MTTDLQSRISARAQQLFDEERKTEKWKLDHGRLSTGGGQSGAPEARHWAQAAVEVARECR